MQGELRRKRSEKNLRKFEERKKKIEKLQALRQNLEQELGRRSFDSGPMLQAVVRGFLCRRRLEERSTNSLRNLDSNQIYLLLLRPHHLDFYREEWKHVDGNTLSAIRNGDDLIKLGISVKLHRDVIWTTLTSMKSKRELLFPPPRKEEEEEDRQSLFEDDFEDDEKEDVGDLFS